MRDTAARPDLERVFSLFSAEGEFRSGKPLGQGHIHDTFLIETAGEESDDYILQRINHNVFRDVPRLQENMERVTSHLRNKISAIAGSDLKRECLTLIGSRKTGKSFITDEEGSFWRMFIAIPDHRSYDRVESPELAFEGGRITGRFMALLSDLPGGPLHETIPRFHDIGWRLENFLHALKSNPAGRAGMAAREIEAVTSRQEEMKTILRLGKQGRIPLRITHNDTKFNNILFDGNDRALLLIDLDTVMPGYVHYDFGGAIRTAANRADEDAADLQSVGIDLEIYRGYAEGFMSEARDTLNPVETGYLHFAPRLLTYTMATRFLTDFLEGDTYYKISHPMHNLQRARAQLALLGDMERHSQQMKEIIAKLT